MDEEWRDIEGFEGYYQISNFGRVKSLDRITQDGIYHRGVIRKTHYDACGYEMVQLRRNGVNKHVSVHRLVAKAFLPNPENLPQVNHKDEVRDHNTVDNLEWCSVLYNQNYGHRKERSSASSTGEKNANHRLTAQDVLEIREKYIPGHPDFGVRPLSELYGVKYVTISKIVQRKLWKNI